MLAELDGALSPGYRGHIDFVDDYPDTLAGFITAPIMTARTRASLGQSAARSKSLAWQSGGSGHGFCFFL
jgi:hypothetical protein